VLSPVLIKKYQKSNFNATLICPNNVALNQAKTSLYQEDF